MSGNADTPFQSNQRLEAFSDGVFAIVITLLVIELSLPELHDPASAGGLYHGLWEIRHKLMSYFVCFAFVGQLWVGHSRFFRLVTRTDVVVFWLNLLLLMFVCLQPFVMAILGDYPDNPGSVIVFGTLFTLTGLAFGLMSWYCRRQGFFNSEVDDRGRSTGIRWTLVIQLLSPIPMALAYVSPMVAMVAYSLLIGGYIAAETQFRVGTAEGTDNRRGLT